MLHEQCPICDAKESPFAPTPEQQAASDRMFKDWQAIVHYWNGYGTLCLTIDARRQDSQCSDDKTAVTCERCMELLARLSENKNSQ